MNPGAYLYDSRPNKDSEHGDSDHGVVWALVIAILFVAVAAISFAVEQSVTLSSLPAGG